MSKGLMSKCFICQSNFKSADDSSRRKRRKKSDNHKNLDPSTWRIFRHYFYPPPLVGSLQDSSSPVQENKSEETEDFSMAGFCESCHQNVSQLCNFHVQLELVQRQISKVVAKVSVTFIEQEENREKGRENCSDCDDDDNLPLNQRKRKAKDKEVPQRCDENKIYSIRRRIRQRYQPKVILKRCNITDKPKQENDGGGCSDDVSHNNNLEIRPQLPPPPAHSNSGDLSQGQEEDFKDDFSWLIKQETEPSPPAKIDHKEPVNEDQDNLNKDEIINQSDPDPNPNPDSPLVHENGESAESPGIKQRMLRKRKKREYITPIEVEDESDDETKNRDPDYNPNPDPDMDNNLVAEKGASSPKSEIESTCPCDEEGKENPGDDYNNNNNDHDYDYEAGTGEKVKKVVAGGSDKSSKAVLKSRQPDQPNQPQVGDNLYEYAGQWRYGQRMAEDNSHLIFYCLACSRTCTKRFLIIRHINRIHLDGIHTGNPHRVRKIDDNNFTYDGIYSITRVTESHGIFFKCGVCGALKKTLQWIANHLKEIHIEPSKFICDQCGFACSSKRKLKRHMTSHAEKTPEEREYICKVCGKSFRNQQNLQAHMEGHSSHFFACECGLEFKYSSSLRRHRVQSGHRVPKTNNPTTQGPAPSFFVPKPCPLCKRIFITEENLQKHRTICSGRTLCSWCGRRSYLPLSLHQQFRCKERFLFQKQTLTLTESPSANTQLNVVIPLPVVVEQGEEEGPVHATINAGEFKGLLEEFPDSEKSSK